MITSVSLICFLLIALVNGQWDQSDVTCEDVAECVNRGLEKHPEYQGKANLYQHACQRACDWKVRCEAERTGLLPANPKLTPAQQSYVKSVSSRPGQQCRAKRQAPAPRVVRKEIRMMTDAERNLFFDALKSLKNTKIDNLSLYDILISDHTPGNAPEAHFCGSFLPYHRQLLYTLENALRKIHPTVSLPYWASVLDHDLPNPADSVLWSDDFLGNGNGDVTSGPFKDWKVYLPSEDMRLSRRGGLFRQMETTGDDLYSYSILTDIANNVYPDFASLTWCVDPTFESLHGGPHNFVGGYMTNIWTSPNDPSFFLHHCFIDSLWEAWRSANANHNDVALGYVSDGQTCGQQQNLTTTNCDTSRSSCLVDSPDAPMSPFSLKVSDGLSQIYTSQYYSYDYITPGKAADLNAGCKQSPYLYFNPVTQQCISKIRQRGNCQGFEGKDICYKSKCKNGTCK